MVLAFTFVLLVSALTLVFWGTTRFLQSYLYSEPADKLPVRSLVAGAAVGGFITFWTLVGTRTEAESKYGTLFDFNPVGSKEVTAFEAVRRYPRRTDGAEETVAFTRKVGSKPVEFVTATGEPYTLVDRNKPFLTIALILDEDGNKSRFNARLNPTRPSEYAAVGDKGDHQFDEERGSRYLDGAFPTTVYAPSRGVLIAALGLNFLMFVAWFAAFWPVLRYGSGHALGLTAACGAATLLVLMPLLFRLNKPRPTAVAPPAATAPQ